jgi:hypothetical protein
MQFDFRDAWRDRGFVIYDDITDKWERMLNHKSPKFYVIDGEDDEDVIHPQENDFVLVTEKDPEQAEGIVQMLRGEGVKWVTSRAAKVPGGPAPRLQLAGQQTQGQVLQAYVRHARPDADDATVARLVEKGIALLSEARV